MPNADPRARGAGSPVVRAKLAELQPAARGTPAALAVRGFIPGLVVGRTRAPGMSKDLRRHGIVSKKGAAVFTDPI